jgi:hypothetical protein
MAAVHTAAFAAKALRLFKALKVKPKLAGYIFVKSAKRQGPRGFQGIFRACSTYLSTDFVDGRVTRSLALGGARVA